MLACFRRCFYLKKIANLEENRMVIDAINSISKPKLPKTYSYVLRSKQLNDLLISNNITIHTDLVYWLPQIIGSILEVHYWLPNHNIPYPRLYVRAGALPRSDIQTARIIMSDEVLPKFSNWLRDIQKHDYNSLYFEAVYKHNMVVEYIL